MFPSPQQALLLKNARVYMAARSSSKALAAIHELESVTGGKRAIFLPLDLASLPSIKAAALEFTTKENELHILFNNGGVMATPIEQLTAEGYDLQFGTNVLGKLSIWNKATFFSCVFQEFGNDSELLRMVSVSLKHDFFFLRSPIMITGTRVVEYFWVLNSSVIVIKDTGYSALNHR